MSHLPFSISGDSLSGRGLSFRVAALGVPAQKESLDALVDMANVIYTEGRGSALLDRTDRHDLSGAVDALRAMAVLAGPTPTGDRFQSYADVLARLLQDQL